MKRADSVPDGDADIVVAMDRTCRRTRCQQWLEALRPVTSAETCVMHRVMMFRRCSIVQRCAVGIGHVDIIHVT